MESDGRLALHPPCFACATCKGRNEEKEPDKVCSAERLINPERAAEEVRQQMETDAKFLNKQEKERQERSAALNASKEADLADLAERHAQQQREHAARYDEERARYMREHAAAERLRAEIEEQRRQQERDADRQRTRGGPEPPDRAR